MNQPVSSLYLPKNVVERLEKSGFNNCQDLDNEFKFDDLTKASATKTALELYKEESRSIIEPQFKSDFDLILKYEITPGRIVEFVGYPGSGKTQVCYHLASFLREAGQCFFISTNKNFCSERLKEIASKYSQKPEDVLERIHCLDVNTIVEFIAALNVFEDWLLQHKNIKLLIIDSISWIIRQQVISERTSLIYTIFQRFRELSSQNKFAIVITNDLTTKFDATAPQFGDAFHHAINTRVLLTKNTAKIVKSVLNQAKEVKFEI